MMPYIPKIGYFLYLTTYILNFSYDTDVTALILDRLVDRNHKIDFT